MYFKVTERTDPPKFIAPTPPNNQHYTVYVGGDFHVSVYAKPTDSASRNISKFNFLRRDGIHVQQTTIQPVPGDPAAVYISMNWSPVESDIGKHIVCANAEDSNGVSTVELHCFKIDVKASIFRPNPTIQGKPYFASFPKQQDIVCPVYSYCRFPIYVATDTIGGVEQIVSTDKSKENVTIQYSSGVINRTIDTKVAQVEFLALTAGPRQICLNATDRFQWSVRCLIVTVERQDPCASIPCQNNGICRAVKDKSDFKCTCNEMYNGTFCENEIQFCKQSPCLNYLSCIKVGVKPYFLCLQCPPGKTGTRCDVDINVCGPTTCSENHICQQNHSSYQCLTGAVHQYCPNDCLKGEASVCVNNQCVCALRHQQNGSCISNQTFRSNNKNPYFIEPTPSSGSIITCDFYGKNCEFPVYLFSNNTPPKLSFFNGTSVFDRTISLSPLKNDADGFYSSIISLSTKFKIEDPKHHEIDLCLNVAETTSPQHITDKRCFHVVDTGVPSVKDSITHLSPNCTFAKPTLPRESTVGCRKGQSCHFYLYSKETDGQCSILTTNDLSTGIFDPKISSGLCRYEVVYTNTSTVGINKICFLVCSSGESRCFQMHTNDIVDQCAANPCLNSAYCQSESTGNFRCLCQEGFWGKYCENGFCNGQSYCQNDAVCFTSNGSRGCLCRLGLEGSNCTLHGNRNLTDTNENGGHFTYLSLVESVTCYLSEPCTMPISITRNIHAMPALEIGFSDKTLKVQSMDLDSSTHAGGIVYGTMTVVGHELGLKRICLDSVSNPRTARIEDEICFQINVTTGNIFEPDKTNPYFVNPTLPTSTVLQCVVNQQCYFNLWARNRVGVEKCPQLEVDKTVEDGVYIFPLRDATKQPCVYESVILIDNVTDLQLCFSLPLDIANSQKDTRCYIIRVLPKVTVKGSCAGMSCYNEGFCDGSSPSSQCLCRSGFSDYNCSKDFGIAQAFNSCTSSQAKFGDVALPTLIRCPLLENCDIPFSVTDTSSLNSFNVTWNGTNFESVNISLSQMSGSRDFTGNAVVVHNATGKHEFCLTLVIRGYAYDSVCCFILTEPAIVPQPPDNGQSLFISPSPSNNSEFSCTAGQPCHVTFRTSKEDDQNCPELHDRSRMSVHIFTALSPNECQRDVLIESQNSTQGTEKYCFETSSSGILGEVRCMTIHFENHGLPTPPPTTTTKTTESPTTVIPSTTTTSSATFDNDHTTTSDNDHTTTSNTVSTSLPENGPESTTNKEISTRQKEQLASKETTLILGSMQTITTLGTAQTTQIQPEQTIVALETGDQATTPVTGETTTTLAAEQTTTTFSAGQTTTTLAAGQTTTTLAAEQKTATMPAARQTSTLGSDQTTTTLAEEQTTTTMPAAGDTTTTLAAGQTTSTLGSRQTTTTLAAEQTTTTMPAAGETTTTLAAGQTTSTLGSRQIITTLAAEQTTRTMPAAEQTTITLAAGQNTTLVEGHTTTKLVEGQTTTTLTTGQTTTLTTGQTTTHATGQIATMLATKQNKTTLATGQTTTIPAGQTRTTLGAGQTTTTLAAGQPTKLAEEQTTTPVEGHTTTTLTTEQTTLTTEKTTTRAAGQTTTTFATGKTITTMQNKRETCDVVDVQEWAKKGRVKCECFHPTGGTTTTVIAKNPHVSGKSLMLAAGLGSGAMVTMLGTGVLLYAVSQKYFGPRKTGPGSDTNQQKKKLSVASCPDKKQLH